MLKAKVTLKKRKQDAYGSGEFGASRAGGTRKHKGCDYVAAVGDIIYPVEAGTVTKLGYPYSNDLSFRYVEVTDVDGKRWRYFYIQPSVQLGDHVLTDTPIGTLQDLSKRYPAITQHCHLEIKTKDDRYLNPETLV